MVAHNFEVFTSKYKKNTKKMQSNRLFPLEKKYLFSLSLLIYIKLLYQPQ